MKKYIVLTIAMLFLGMSCTLIPVPVELIPGKTFDEKWLWVTENIEYQSEDDNGIDDWKQPENTRIDGNGDCEDFVGLLLNDLTAMGEDATLTVIRQYGVKHAILHYKGQYLSGQVYNYYYHLNAGDALQEYTYDQYMIHALRDGR